jgi:hypothetical protein
MCEVETKEEVITSLQDQLELSLVLSGEWLAEEEIREICLDKGLTPPGKGMSSFSEIISRLDENEGD